MKQIKSSQIEQILELAVRAPSGDNCQPWNFKWDGQFLFVIHNSRTAKHVLNHSGRASQIALGCLIESIDLAASQFGFSTSTNLKTFELSVESTWAKISFQASTRGTDPLVVYLASRTTDRRNFEGGKLPRAELQAACRASGARIHFAETISERLLNYLLKTESLAASHPSILPDTLKWIRWTKSQQNRTKDGMIWKGLGVRYFELPALFLMRFLSFLVPVFGRLGMKKQYIHSTKDRLESSAGLYCFSISKYHHTSFVEVGRTAMRAWLKLTELGYGVQPLTIASLSALENQNGTTDEVTKNLFSRILQPGPEILKSEFRVADEREVVWMFRTGRSSPLPADCITQRKQLKILISNETSEIQNAV